MMNYMDEVAHFRLRHISEIMVSEAPRYLIDGVLPARGLTVLYGEPKTGKSFLALAFATHVSAGIKIDDRAVKQGPVIYIAAEGGIAFSDRVIACRDWCRTIRDRYPDFYLLSAGVDLVNEINLLVQDIHRKLEGKSPALIVVDTLNRTFEGSEASDEHMTRYIKSLDRIVACFDCSVLLVHHCGKKPSSGLRGHSALSGALDAQIQVKRIHRGRVEAKVELMRDGPAGDVLTAFLLGAVIATSDRSNEISTLLARIVEIKSPDCKKEKPNNEEVMLTILESAGSEGLSTKDLNERMRAKGIGKGRPATLNDIRKRLLAKRKIEEIEGEKFRICQESG